MGRKQKYVHIHTTWDIFTGGQSLRTHPSTYETVSQVGRVNAHIQVHMRHFHGWAEFMHTSKYTWDSFTGGHSLRTHPINHETFSREGRVYAVLDLEVHQSKFKNYLPFFISHSFAVEELWNTNANSVVWLFDLGWREGVNCPFPLGNFSFPSTYDSYKGRLCS